MENEKEKDNDATTTAGCSQRPNNQNNNDTALCRICTRPFTSKLRLMASCPYESCGGSACVSCIRSHMSINKTIACMFCSKPLSFTYLNSTLLSTTSKDLVRNAYKEVFFAREKRLFGHTATAVAIERLKRKKMKRVSALKEAIAAQKEALKALRLLIRNNQLQLGREEIVPVRPSRNAVHLEPTLTKCSHSDCEGFLLTNGACVRCESHTCMDCNRPLKIDDVQHDHMCDPDDVATVSHIANTSKPCPSCGTPITKTQGCNQMFCIACDHAFDWGTLRELDPTYGNYHNPEHALRLRLGVDSLAVDGGGRMTPDAPLRNPLDTPCGGPPSEQMFFNVLRRYTSVQTSRNYPNYIAPSVKVYVNNLRRGSENLRHIHMPMYYRSYRANVATTALRVRYIIGDIDDAEFKNDLLKQHVVYNTSKEIYMIISYVIETAEDVLRFLVNVLGSPALYVYDETATATATAVGDIETKAVPVQSPKLPGQIVTEYVRNASHDMATLVSLANKDLQKIAISYGLSTTIVISNACDVFRVPTKHHV